MENYGCLPENKNFYLIPFLLVFLLLVIVSSREILVVWFWTSLLPAICENFSNLKKRLLGTDYKACGR